MSSMMLLALIEIENNPHNPHNPHNHRHLADLEEIRGQSDAPTLILMFIMAVIFIISMLIEEFTQS